MMNSAFSKRCGLAFSLIALSFSMGCESTKTETGTTSPTPSTNEQGNSGGKVSTENPIVVMETNHGSIEIELDQKKAPISVENFLKYVDDGFYSGTICHRVIDGFMIQGGGFTKDMDQKS